MVDTIPVVKHIYFPLGLASYHRSVREQQHIECALSIFYWDSRSTDATYGSTYHRQYSMTDSFMDPHVDPHVNPIEQTHT